MAYAERRARQRCAFVTVCDGERVLLWSARHSRGVGGDEALDAWKRVLLSGLDAYETWDNVAETQIDRVEHDGSDKSPAKRGSDKSGGYPKAQGGEAQRDPGQGGCPRERQEGWQLGQVRRKDGGNGCEGRRQASRRRSNSRQGGAQTARTTLVTSLRSTRLPDGPLKERDWQLPSR